MVRLGVAGTGYWGINLVRAFARQPDCALVALCDPDAAALGRAAAFAPNARRLASFEELVASEIDALVLATPAVAHAPQARAALAAGKHVFVEKPMALDEADAAQLVALARELRRTLMVGHLMLYHPGYERTRELLHSGALGELYYIYALRVNLGRLRRDENALWSFAPHDLSMILDLVGAAPSTVAARGQAYLQPGIEDVVFLNLTFPGRQMAQVQLSWLDPRKERRLTVVGSKKMAEFDDAHPTEKLRIYDKGYDRPPTFTRFSEYLTVRSGDIHIPRLQMTEPLEAECAEFIRCVRQGARPRTDGEHGLAVVRVLAAAQRSLSAGGAPVSL